MEDGTAEDHAPDSAASASLQGGKSPGQEPRSDSDLRSVQRLLSTVLVDRAYLDSEKRYQLRKPLPKATSFSEDLEIGIVDCQPAAKSPVAELLEQHPSQSAADCFPATSLPAVAYPYWKLQEQFFPVVPELQAAWQRDGYVVLVLEDRSSWLSLIEALSAEALDPLQLIHWFYEMVILWEGLTDFAAERSLLEPQNLRVDDDHILCIERLLYNLSDRTYTVQNLGTLWESLLLQCAGTPVTAIENLAVDVSAGIVTDTATIRDILSNIADSLESDVPEDDTADLKMNLRTERLSESLPAVSEETLASLNADTSDAGTSDTSSIAIDDLFLPERLEVGEDDANGFDDGAGDLPTMALPMTLHRLDEVGRTHVGRQRSHNEDSFFAETQLRRIDSPSGPVLNAHGLYILCDGMGGHSGGEIASSLAVETLRAYYSEHWKADLPDETVIKEGILRANQVIFAKNESEKRVGSDRMGTTLVLVMVADNQAVVAHVGDSRLYCVTRQGAEQLTVDHEVGQREIERGVEPDIAYARPDAYQLTQALGPRKDSEVSPGINFFQVSQDTLLLLCSDGLSDNHLLETHAASHLEPLLRSRYDLEEGVANLIDLANEHNGHDNITAIAVRIKVRPSIQVAKGLVTPATSSEEASELMAER